MINGVAEVAVGVGVAAHGGAPPQSLLLWLWVLCVSVCGSLFLLDKFSWGYAWNGATERKMHYAITASAMFELNHNKSLKREPSLRLLPPMTGSRLTAACIPSRPKS
jgi:hypothetical protein